MKAPNDREDRRGPTPPPHQSPNERAFVVQFEPVAGARARSRGRVELVASGEATRFRSLKQLVGFMVSTLRKRAAAEPPEQDNQQEERAMKLRPGLEGPGALRAGRLTLASSQSSRDLFSPRP